MPEIAKTYEPNQTESKWYSYWLEKNIFTANPKSPKPAYSIVIPPPNVTGILHMGHVLNNTIQDILSRKARMEGFEVLWLPGTDHAGIATQVVVEKKIKKEEGKNRHDVGREEFVNRVWAWKEKHGGIIIDQLKKLGCSCDWSRERFTMDPEYCRLVAETFVDLYHKGNIYRGKRMVNWCPVSLTALSDEEVIMKPQKGLMYYFKVEVAERPGTCLTIATTRPETIPGDTAVAVNPKDSRFSEYIGLHVIRPLPAELNREEKLIPIIADEHVQFEFGTGVLKVTPAHDKADFDIGQRHKLPFLEVIDERGYMHQKAGTGLAGLDRFKARKVAVEKLKEIDAFDKEEPYENNVGFSERADVPIEPRLSEQWFMRYPSVKESREVVQKGELKFYPDRWAKVYEHWLANIQDWCISRQLWWGHQIPVWYRGEEVKCQVESPGPDWKQDPDVLDTWCSAWLWPFATMDAETKAKFYPTTVLVTAPEILFFWVARMIMAGFEYTGKKPFADVYLTGIVRDKAGRKMSKSLGNSPDPLDLISRYGADALRFGVMRSAPLGQDVLYDEQQVELGRNFCTKLWNACRFRQMQTGESEAEITPDLLNSDDKWILLKLDAAIRELDAAFINYNFNEATQTLYRFFWGEFCDWYLETTKAVFNTGTDAQKQNTLAVIDFVLSNTLRLFHPFLPFITEELWHGLGFNSDLPAGQGRDTISFANWPKPFDDDFKAHYKLAQHDLEFAETKYELVRQGRNLRREGNIPSNKKVKFVLKTSQPLSNYEAEVLRILLIGESVEVNPAYEAAKGTPAARSPMGELYLPLEGLVDVQAERARLTKEISKVEIEVQKVEEKLANPSFVQKVPPAVLDEHRKRLTEWSSKLEMLKAAVQRLG